MRKKVSLRRFPYPFKSALTICSDLDSVTPQTFLEIHRFLNTTQSTPMGPGVGLEIGDSFWMYSAQPAWSKPLTYFRGTEPFETVWAPMIRAFIRAGYIDCLHAYGDFTGQGGFKRQLAARAVEQLEDQGIQISVWTNHGDRHNFQNLDEFYSLGDVKETQSADGDPMETLEYHLDLTQRLGVKFFWRSMDLTQIWGQNRGLKASDICTWERMRYPRTYIRWLENMVREGIHAHGFNPLLQAVKLRDGSTLHAFKRYGRFPEDRSDDVDTMLGQEHLNDLIRREGVAVLYTHLGKRLDRQGPAVPVNTQKGLRRLAQAYQDGQIFVTTTSKLLRYCLMHDSLDYTVGEVPNLLWIEIKGEWTAQDLEGLTFYVNTQKKIWLICGKENLNVQENPPDHTGMRSVSVARVPLSTKPLERYFKQI